MKSVSIVGVGLIGASFGLALRKAGFRGRLIGVSSVGAIRDALACGAIDEALPLAEAAAQSDLVFLAQPIQRIIETLGALDPHLRPGTLVTDVGSTKVRIVEAGHSIRRGRFLGGHPMAGKETRGAASADADLFRGRTWVLTEEPPEEFRTWLEAIGAVVVILPAEVHDRLVARTSHLPQLMSTALALTLSPEHLQVAGPGLADALRLAASSYDIWGDILATNRAQIDAALSALIQELENLRATLGTEASKKAFEKAHAFAARLRR